MVTRESRDDERLRRGIRKLPAAQSQQQRQDFYMSNSLRQPLSARISRQDVGMRSSDATVVGSRRNKSRQSSLAPRASALLRAVQRGDYEGLAGLLESSNNSYPNEQEQGAEDAGVLGALLTEACGREHLDCIELLLQRMRRPKRSLKRRGYFPMHAAAGTGAVESMELLISAGLSPRSQDDGGRTPLHHAAAHGSAECVSFLCAFARNTVRTGDRRVGDTPLHFAVRASHAVCIQVLLAHAGTELAHESNAKGETPLDVARALCEINYDSACLRALEDGTRRRHTAVGSQNFGGAHSGLKGGVDLQRIMAVWERFFENAARACVGSDLAKLSVEEDSYDEPRHSSSPPGTTTFEGLGVQNTVCFENGQRAPAGRAEGRGRVTETASEGGDGGAWGRGEDGRRYGDSDESFELFHLLDTSEVVPTPLRAWEVESLVDHGCDSRQGGGRSIHASTITQGRERSFQNEVLGNEISPTGDDHGFCLTPRGGTGRRAWSSDTVHADTDMYEVSTTVATPLDDAWVACWDAASEAIYYWNSARGELTWNAPLVGSAAVSNRIWDPEQEDFFAIDESGEPHWLGASNTTSIPSAATSTDCAVDGAGASGAATSGDERSPQEWSTPSLAQELKYSLNEDDDDDDVFFHPAVAEEGLWFRGENTVGGNSRGGGGGGSGCNGSGSQAMEASYATTAEDLVGETNQVCADDALYFFDAQDESNHIVGGLSALFPSQITVEEETQPPPVHTGDIAEFTVDEDNIDEVRIGDGARFFDAETYGTQEPGNRMSAVHANGTVGGLDRKAKQEADTSSVGKAETNDLARLLPRWVVWCPCSPDSPSYFIDEDNSDTSWVLPPGVVVPSKGWLRAWSEEHQAYFYSNQWTAKATWEVDDLLGVEG